MAGYQSTQSTIMILSFSRQFPWKEPTNFIQKIQEGTKIHTFRIGHRWKVGDKIHFWDQNPRSTMMKPKPKPFNIPYNKASNWMIRSSTDLKGCLTIPKQSYDLPKVVAIEDFKIEFGVYELSKIYFKLEIGDQYVIYDSTSDLQTKCIGGTCPSFFLDEVAKNDGFENESEFIKYFAFEMIERPTLPEETIEGQIIHWTDKTYVNGPTFGDLPTKVGSCK